MFFTFPRLNVIAVSWFWFALKFGEVEITSYDLTRESLLFLNHATFKYSKPSIWIEN